MSKEKLNKGESLSKNIENQSGKDEKKTTAARKAIAWLRDNWKKSAILAGSGAVSMSSFGQSGDINKKADQIFANPVSHKTEWYIPSINGVDKIYFASEDARNSWAKGHNVILKENGNTINLDSRGTGKTFRFYSPDFKQYKDFNSEAEAKDFSDKHNNDRERFSSHLVVIEKDGKEHRLNGDAITASDAKNLENASGSNNQSNNISENVSTNQDKKQVTEGRTYRFSSPDGKLHKDFNSIQELENFAKSVNNPVNASKITVIEKDGKEHKMTTEEFNEVAKDVNTEGSSVQNNSASNIPGQASVANTSGEAGLNLTNVTDKLPRGKGEVLQMNDDGTATIYKVSKNKRTTKIKKRKSMIVNPSTSQQ